MRIIRGVDAARPEDRGATAAMGNFDGVHRGHRAVLELAAAAAPDAPLGVVTFDPHPRRFFQPDAEPFALMSFEAKARRLERLGVERLFALPFDAGLAALTPAAFCEAVLAEGLGLRHVTVGADFCFGKGRAGDGATLRAEGARLGFGATLAPLVADGGEPVSSTAIRSALREGRPEEAARMLGHWHRIEGVVEHGEKRGRTLGYPTANLSLGDLAPPKFGVYAVKVDVLDGPHAGQRRGVASLGVRPMFGENRPNLETFLFDFSGDLYGARISVALVAFQRPELKFESVEALVRQMDEDSAQARRLLAAAA
ncbi:bifunctional riboflavin kinase/FAD synthetase [Rubrimonas cliftonensis]|uniref:Riboflavin biosynthesis protein n=1 Tax=Rubrimonas cliftonensis TaxID=89524 RepID=A0A1H3XFX3_9RHOB|nr:bifunctional riboflavin kinase/FAD synthetase [Rubrimonas cliftonensis]SDZ98297.1 riboflavin kinase / FMN adenylyltransferase [Rubrimonas cliftonensis]